MLMKGVICYGNIGQRLSLSKRVRVSMWSSRLRWVTDDLKRCYPTSCSGCNGVPQRHHINMVELQKERVTEVFWFICHPVDLQVVDIRSFLSSIACVLARNK